MGTLTRHSLIHNKELLNFEIGGLDGRFIKNELKTRVHCIHMEHLICSALVHVIYSVVSGQYSYTIVLYREVNAIGSFC